MNTKNKTISELRQAYISNRVHQNPLIIKKDICDLEPSFFSGSLSEISEKINQLAITHKVTEGTVLKIESFEVEADSSCETTSTIFSLFSERSENPEEQQERIDSVSENFDREIQRVIKAIVAGWPPSPFSKEILIALVL